MKNTKKKRKRIPKTIVSEKVTSSNYGEAFLLYIYSNEGLTLPKKQRKLL